MKETCVQCGSPVINKYDRLCPACLEPEESYGYFSFCLDNIEELEENSEKDIDI